MNRALTAAAAGRAGRRIGRRCSRSRRCASVLRPARSSPKPGFRRSPRGARSPIDFASYDYRTIDRDFTRVSNEATGKFRSDFSTQSAGVRDAIVAVKATSTAQIASAGTVNVALTHRAGHRRAQPHGHQHAGSQRDPERIRRADVPRQA